MTTNTGFFGRFFNLKTTDQINAEAQSQKMVSIARAQPHGLNSYVDEQQLALDKMREKSATFLEDITTHFSAASDFLSPDYTGKSKIVTSNNGVVLQFGMKWTCPADDFDTSIGFSYVNGDEAGIRVDYIFSRDATTSKIKVINSAYTGNGQTTIGLNDSEESIRTVRRFVTHEDFMAGPVIPSWFVLQLKTYAVKVP